MPVSGLGSDVDVSLSDEGTVGTSDEGSVGTSDEGSVGTSDEGFVGVLDEDNLVNLTVTTSLSPIPGFAAIAFIVVVSLIVNAPVYLVLDIVGVVPSVV